MKLSRIFLIVSIAALLVGCSTLRGDLVVGSGKVITETRKVDNFTGLDSTCSADVTIVQGRTLAVSIEGEDNILPLIVTKVSGGVLSVEAKPTSSFRTTEPLVVHITIPELGSIRVTGSGDVDMTSWAADRLEFEVTGSGDIRIGSLQTTSVTARLSGSGDVTLSAGKAGSQSVHVSGSGNFKSEGLESARVDATLSGSGDVTVWVTESLSVNLSGSGDLRYYGAPGLTQDASGSGTVEKLGDRP